MWSVWTGDESNSAFDVEQQVRFDAGQIFFLFFFFLPFLFVFLYLLNVNLSDFNMVLAKDTKLQRCDVLRICKKMKILGSFALFGTMATIARFSTWVAYGLQPSDFSWVFFLCRVL